MTLPTSGVRTAQEPVRPTATCERCGGFVRPAQLRSNRLGMRVCPDCLERTGSLQEAPWETGMGAGTFSGFFATLYRVFFQPSAFFGQLPPANGKLAAPFRFAVYCHAARCLLLTLPAGLEAVRLLPQFHCQVSPFEWAQFVAFVLAAAALLVLAGTLLRLFVLGAVEHLLLLLLGAGRGGVGATIRASGYSSAVAMLGAVPSLWWVGESASLVWRVLAYRGVHRNRGARTIGTAVAVALVALGYFIVQDVTKAILDGAGAGLLAGLGPPAPR